jgi:hypothetical protein
VVTNSQVASSKRVRHVRAGPGGRPFEGIEAVAGDEVAVEAVSSDGFHPVDPGFLAPDDGEGDGLTGRYFADGGAVGNA